MTTTVSPPHEQAHAVHAGSTREAAESDGHGLPISDRLVPGRDAWTDLVALAVLTCLALYGFDKAYGGSRYFIAGVVGTVLGSFVGHLCARTRQPLLVVTAATVLTFFVFGGAVAVPDRAFAGVLPSLGSVAALADGLVQGWAKLLTTVPPVGSAANLLTVPYACGLLAGVVAVTITARTRRPLFALVPPLIVLVLGILFGTDEPASLVLQGALFAAVALWWASQRRRRSRRVDVGTRSTRRHFGAVALLGLAGLLAVLVGDQIPGAGSRDRVILRDLTEPPFDPTEYPSPLNSYRRYVEPAPDGLREEPLLEISGLSGDQRVRLAAMDTYDGLVYSVAAGSGSSGYFQRVGERIPGEGEEHVIEIEVLGYSGVWVPDVGELVSIDFVGADPARNAELEESFRYNMATGTAAVGVGLRAGDRYELRYRSSDDDVMPDGERVALPAVESVGPVVEAAERYAGDATDPFEKADLIAKGLVADGYFSDGVHDDAPSRPGHGAKRLSEMVTPNLPPVGNGEQYAPTAALMSVAVGVPARVVMGFAADAGGTVTITGEDVAAWIEVHDGVRWREIVDLLPDRDDPPPASTDTKPQATDASPPPPPTSVPPADDTDVETETTSGEDDCEAAGAAGGPMPDGCDEGGGLPGWLRVVATIGGVGSLPFVVLGGFTGTVAAAKARRRHRRRAHGSPTERIAGGWNEITDLASDLGAPVPRRLTRRESAAMIGHPEASLLAQHADGDIFGPGERGDTDVDTYWHHVESTRRAMVADRTRFERWKALVSLASLRASADRPERRGAGVRSGSGGRPGRVGRTEMAGNG